MLPERDVMARDRRDGSSSSGWQNRRLYLPAYRVSEVARLAKTTPQTITRWYRGYEAPEHRRRPVLPSDRTPLLSYLQLIEVAFVATFRGLGIKLDALRQAREYCVKTFASEYPFAQLRFKTDGVHVLHTWAEHQQGNLEVEQLVATDAGGQLVWAPAVAERLSEFDYEEGLALRWHPRGRGSVILVDPKNMVGCRRDAVRMPMCWPTFVRSRVRLAASPKYWSTKGLS